MNQTTNTITNKIMKILLNTIKYWIGLILKYPLTPKENWQDARFRATPNPRIDKLLSEFQKETLNIEIKEYWDKCGDGCCDYFGTIITINGKELEGRDQSEAAILRNVLEYLGYKVNIKES